MALSTGQTVDIALIREICDLPDDIYRNRWITYVYGNLADQLREHIGRENASWCTFAKWSSFTIGENLRLDKPAPRIREQLKRHPHLLAPVRPIVLTLQLRMRSLGDSSMPRVLALGNRLVFHEIGYSVAHYLGWLAGQTHEDDAAWRVYRRDIEAYAATELFRAGNLEWLRDGLGCYYRAKWEQDPMRRAELVFRGNLLLAIYEQWRVDVILRVAMDPVARRFIEFSAEQPHQPGNARLIHPGTPWAVRHQLPLLRLIARLYSGIVTRHVMTFDAPVDGHDIDRLVLGRGVPNIDDGPQYAAPLEQLVDPTLRRLVEFYDGAHGRLEDTRPRDWTSFSQRMTFILNLFRVAQQSESLYRALPKRHLELLELDLSDTNLNVLRRKGDGDPGLDATVAAVAVPPYPNGPRGLVAQLIDTAQGPDLGLPSPPLPRWASRDLMLRGQAFFANYGLEVASALFSASLPKSYSAAPGAQVLSATAELVSDPERRLAETGQLLLDVFASDPSPLGPHTRGYRTARGVRLFHAAVRNMLQNDPEVDWDIEELGVPINQEDLLGTLAAFTCVALQALDKMGVAYTEKDRRDRDGYFHLWLVVGHLLGIDYSLLRDENAPELAQDEVPLTYPQMLEVASAIYRRNQGSSAAGQQLTHALLEVTEDSMPRPLRGFPRSATRRLVGDEVADMLGVGPPTAVGMLFDMLRPVTRVLTGGHGRAVSHFTGVVTRHLYRSWIDEHHGDRPPWTFPTVRAPWGLDPVTTRITGHVRSIPVVGGLMAGIVGQVLRAEPGSEDHPGPEASGFGAGGFDGTAGTRDDTVLLALEEAFEEAEGLADGLADGLGPAGGNGTTRQDAAGPGPGAAS